MRKMFPLTLAGAVVLAAAPLTAQQPVTKPGPEHAMLKQSVGDWDAIVKTKEGEIKGTAHFEMAPGGLWLLEHFKADFGGMPFAGYGASTYNPAKKKFVGVWIDSMETSPFNFEGTYDKATKTLTQSGDMTMPGGKTMKATMTTVYTDANTHTFTLNGTGADGKSFEMIQITYKRKVK